ncbi:MAG: hypothetical protein RLZZ272_1712, partial [Actinomycetota bacterium]
RDGPPPDRVSGRRWRAGRPTAAAPIGRSSTAGGRAPHGDADHRVDGSRGPTPWGPRTAVPGAPDRTDRRSGTVRADGRSRDRPGAAPDHRSSSEGRWHGADRRSHLPRGGRSTAGRERRRLERVGEGCSARSARTALGRGRVGRPEAAPRGAALPAAGALSGRAHLPRRPGGPARAPGAFARPGTIGSRARRCPHGSRSRRGPATLRTWGRPSAPALGSGPGATGAHRHPHRRR